MNVNNDSNIRIKIDSKLYEALKKITNKNNETINDIIKEFLKKYVYDNLDLLVGSDKK